VVHREPPGTGPRGAIIKLKLILSTAVVGMVVCLLGAAAPAQAAPFVYVANSGSNDVSQYDVGAGGLLAPLSPATVAVGASSPLWVAVSPDGGSVYVVNDSPPSVSQFDVGAGALSPKSPATVATGAGPLGIAVSPDGGSVYVGGATGVSQYDVGAGGALSPKSPATVATGGSAIGVAVSPDNHSVYVATNVLSNNAVVGSVAQFDVGAGGTLLPKTPASVAAGSGALGVAVSPDGGSVYVTNFFSNDVSQYDVGAGGALSPKSPATVTTGSGAVHLAVGPDGGSVYVTNRLSVSQYDVSAGGALSPKSPATVATGGSSSGVAVSPDNHSVYVTNGFDDSVFQYDVGAGGVLTPKSPATVATGDVPGVVAVRPAPQVPTSKEQCKNGGWRNFPQFKNEGQCITFVNRGP
jgi:DNA-binding beta-propeller fold protein YncE